MLFFLAATTGFCGFFRVIKFSWVFRPCNGKQLRHHRLLFFALLGVQIDVDDMNALGYDKPGWNAGASPIHELTEQREDAVGENAKSDRARSHGWIWSIGRRDELAEARILKLLFF
jgi:hypothetical protein